MIRSNRDRMAARSKRRRPRQDGSRWLLPAIGAITPILLIVVNIAAFVVHHLQTFRLVIAILAFVSGLMLNSWWGIEAYRFVKKRAPDHELVHERNYEVLLMGGMLVIILISFVTAWFCYQGLSSDKDLPNLSTFIVGVVAILLPIIGRTGFERANGDDPPARPLDDDGI